MDELIKLVVKKTGIQEAQAKAAVETVLGFLKQKLPAPFASQLDAVVKGGAVNEDLLKGLGGLFGKK